MAHRAAPVLAWVAGAAGAAVVGLAAVTSVRDSVRDAPIQVLKPAEIDRIIERPGSVRTPAPAPVAEDPAAEPPAEPPTEPPDGPSSTGGGAVTQFGTGAGDEAAVAADRAPRGAGDPSGTEGETGAGGQTEGDEEADGGIPGHSGGVADRGATKGPEAPGDPTGGAGEPSAEPS
ncbi:MAG: hypothetical protein WCF04_09395, partial [Candidatus Nanopelagicales bacterium]